MTLTIVINIPDGIVLASDSLQTITAETHGNLMVPTKCPECKKDVNQIIPIAQNNSIRGSQNCQKIFNLKGNKGILLDNLAFFKNRTIESYVREFNLKVCDPNNSVEETADKLIDFLSTVLTDNKIKKSVASSIGFQIAGIDKNDFKGKIVSVNVGTKVDKSVVNDFTVSWRGYDHVLQKIFSPIVINGTPIPEPRPDLRFMTIQDGIDYALFLLRTTIEYQRFAIMNETVGGAIDIAIITPHSGFEWIQKKQLNDEKGESQLRKDNINSRFLRQITESISVLREKEISNVEILEKEAVSG